MTNKDLEELEERFLEQPEEQAGDAQSEERKYWSLFALLYRKRKRKERKDMFQSFHKQMNKEEEGHGRIPLNYRFKSFSRRYLVPSLVAASISILVVFASLYTYSYMQSLEQKQISYYKSMRREMARIKAQTKRIQRAYNQLKEDDQEQVRYYGATGFLLNTEGYLVTDYHVVKGSSMIFAEKDTFSYALDLVSSFPEYDLALLKVRDSTFQAAALPFSIDTCGRAQLGENIFSLGYPKQDLVYGEGTVASMSGFEDDTLSYQISIPINPGNSGAPVLSQHGDLIGIVTGKHTAADGVAYAIKSCYLHKIIRKVNADSTRESPVLMPEYNRLKGMSKEQKVAAVSEAVYMIKASGR